MRIGGEIYSEFDRTRIAKGASDVMTQTNSGQTQTKEKRNGGRFDAFSSA